MTACSWLHICMYSPMNACKSRNLNIDSRVIAVSAQQGTFRDTAIGIIRLINVRVLRYTIQARTIISI